MKADEVRLECLRLSHRHDLGPQAIVNRAAAFERYVSKGVQEEAPAPKQEDVETGKQTETAGNPFA
jgi:hypothetical protein